MWNSASPRCRFLYIMWHLSSLISSFPISLKTTCLISLNSQLHNPCDLSGRLLPRKPKARVSPVRRLPVPHTVPKDSAMDSANSNSCGSALTFFVQISNRSFGIICCGYNFNIPFLCNRNTIDLLNFWGAWGEFPLQAMGTRTTQTLNCRRKSQSWFFM